jgi:hypothetical protein
MAIFRRFLTILNAGLAYSINKYTNIKKKLLTCNANIYFNKSRLSYKAIPQYAQINIKTSNTYEAAKRTETEACSLRIKNEIKTLYKKKLCLNKTLYSLHISNVNTWGNTWNIISHNITNTVENLMKLKYNTNMKLKKLKDEQRINTQQHTNTFYQCIDNLSNVIFTDEETQLLSKGLKYNLHHK